MQTSFLRHAQCMCYVPFVTRSRLINGPGMGVSRLTNGPASVVTQMGQARLCTWPICVFPWWRSGSQTGPAGRHTNGTVPFVIRIVHSLSNGTLPFVHETVSQTGRSRLCSIRLYTNGTVPFVFRRENKRYDKTQTGQHEAGMP